MEIKYKECLDFLSVHINEELSMEEKLKNIIRYHVITSRNSQKLKAKTLFDLKSIRSGPKNKTTEINL